MHDAALYIAYAMSFRYTGTKADKVCGHKPELCTSLFSIFPQPTSFDKAAITFSYTLNFLSPSSHEKTFGSPQSLKSLSVYSGESTAVF